MQTAPLPCIKLKMYSLHSTGKLYRESAKFIWSKHNLKKRRRIVIFYVLEKMNSTSYSQTKLRFYLFSAYYLPQNAGDIARKFIKDQELLSFIDAEVWDICELTHFSSFPLWPCGLHSILF
jgi:hypothetical protein